MSTTEELDAEKRLLASMRQAKTILKVAERKEITFSRAS